MRNRVFLTALLLLALATAADRREPADEGTDEEYFYPQMKNDMIVFKGGQQRPTENKATTSSFRFSKPTKKKKTTTPVVKRKKQKTTKKMNKSKKKNAKRTESIPRFVANCISRGTMAALCNRLSGFDKTSCEEGIAKLCWKDQCVQQNLASCSTVNNNSNINKKNTNKSQSKKHDESDCRANVLKRCEAVSKCQIDAPRICQMKVGPLPSKSSNNSTNSTKDKSTNTNKRRLAVCIAQERQNCNKSGGKEDTSSASLSSKSFLCMEKQNRPCLSLTGSMLSTCLLASRESCIGKVALPPVKKKTAPKKKAVSPAVKKTTAPAMQKMMNEMKQSLVSEIRKGLALKKKESNIPFSKPGQTIGRIYLPVTAYKDHLLGAEKSVLERQKARREKALENKKIDNLLNTIDKESHKFTEPHLVDGDGLELKKRKSAADKKAMITRIKILPLPSNISPFSGTMAPLPTAHVPFPPAPPTLTTKMQLIASEVSLNDQ